MTVKVNVDEVTPESNEVQNTWRLLRRGAPGTFGVGVAAFKPRRTGIDPESTAEAHDVPEIHYVVSGRGVLTHDGVAIELRPGDAVLTPAGVRHALWATSAEPMVTIYVATGSGAGGKGTAR